MKQRFTLALLCLGLSLPASMLYAQTVRTVCAGGGCNYTSIQAAMNAAVSGDTILLNVNGAFTEKDIIIPEKNLVLRGLGKGITVLQSAASAAHTSGGRIFNYLDPVGTVGTSITIENMTLQNGYAPVDANGQAVGGVFFGRATKGLKLTFNNVRMYNNQTRPGGTLNSGGGCIYITATGTGHTYNADVVLKNSEFDNNSAGNALTNAWGGCISLMGNLSNRLTVDNCSFSNNSAYNGGGVIYCGSNWMLYLKNSKFENNSFRVSGDGGCFKGTSGNWNFDNCLFVNNKALVGTGLGGVWSGAGAKFKSCTFYGNEAVKGGAIYRQSPGFAVNGTTEMQLINCTFYGNKASSTGRSIHYGSTSPTAVMPLIMINSIITGGTGTAANDFHFTLPYAQMITNIKNYCPSIGTELTSGGTAPVFDFHTGNTTPGLSATLSANGGSFQSLALSSNSTFINAGTNLTGTSYDIGIKDQRNYSRFDGSIDVGSFEYNGIADDALLPVISYTALSNTMLTTSRSITATITDETGVYWYPQTGDYRPRIYFRKNNGAWVSAAGTPQTGDGINGNWLFTISSTAMGSLAMGDIVSYYIVAQDVSSEANISSSPAGVVAADVNTIAGAPSAATYIIGTVLPVKLNHFTAKATAGSCLLSWVADEQVNLDRYELERSTNGREWKTIASLSANNSLRYDYTDAGLAEGIYFYRLRMVDADGKLSLSDSRTIRIAKTAAKFSVQGNPVENGKLVIKIHQPTQLLLFDTNGKMVWKKNLQPSLLQVNVSSYAKGMYFLTSGETAERIKIQ
ncbi:MAG: T9SS type A sorting domain-containing protein [Chitinophagaceae bacterium]|nr:MAG: T9SS type A sorting domain-containing protein [Chitinophagaceae bacterium]